MVLSEKRNSTFFTIIILIELYFSIIYDCLVFIINNIRWKTIPIYGLQTLRPSQIETEIRTQIVRELDFVTHISKKNVYKLPITVYQYAHRWCCARRFIEWTKWITIFYTKMAWVVLDDTIFFCGQNKTVRTHYKVQWIHSNIRWNTPNYIKNIMKSLQIYAWRVQCVHYMRDICSPLCNECVDVNTNFHL